MKQKQEKAAADLKTQAKQRDELQQQLDKMRDDLAAQLRAKDAQRAEVLQ
jgi:hypothetical protein